MEVVPPMIGFEDQEFGRDCLHADFANKVRVWVSIDRVDGGAAVPSPTLSPTDPVPRAY